MEQIENLLKTALGEIERLLSTKTVVGDPIEVGGNTIVPLVAVAFGFGGGGGTGEDQKATSTKGTGAGTGGGGGVKPVAVVIVDKNGVARVEAIRGSATVVEKVGEAVTKIMESRKNAETGSKSA
ncbi:MAG: spore germination protein GerW family protein [Acidobacteriota bacterium]|nr:spore germination protein GerW family protein [Acidobacteriota bacterium]